MNSTARSEFMKISVIVPAYNVEKYISRCLNSLLKQTYKNLEVIVVNDGSTDNTQILIEQFCVKDSRIKLINHEKNMGLFHARLTGVKNAVGNYIGFVDSDDYVSEDYYRTLVYEAIEKEADIVVGKIVQENEQGYQWIQNLYDNFSFGVIKGREIWDNYWRQEGQLFIWHTVWNKLYAAKLWQDALPELEKQTEHLIMCEDFVFSSILFYYARTLSGVDYGTYFYYRNSNASTAITGGVKKYQKNVKDVLTAFVFVRSFFTKMETRGEVIKHFERWEALYKYFWIENVFRGNITSHERASLCSDLNLKLKGNDTPSFPDYFYSASTPFDARYNQLISAICSDEVKVVSFDVFDTALIRPFMKPEDVFRCLNHEFENLMPGTRLEFSKIRVKTESELRREKIYSANSSAEDISLDEIYEKIQKIYNLTDDVKNRLQELEIETEKKFLTKRKSIFNLYLLTLHLNKKVVFTSDMYVDCDLLHSILYSNGYTDCSGVFVSSTFSASKRTGKLYQKVLDYFGIEGRELVHIGDNWETDIIKAREYGIKAIFYPKTTDCIFYNISDIHTTHSLGGFKGRINSLINYEKGLTYFGVRNAIALAANKLYDMPFLSYNDWSEGNASPQFFGYMALGMHLLGITKWIAGNCEKEHYDKLVFIARDGYLPMKAYEIYQKHLSKNKKKTEYFYTSRKAALACGIATKDDLYDIYEQLGTDKLTGSKIAEMLSPVLDLDRLDTRQRKKLENVVDSNLSYCDLVDDIFVQIFDEKKAEIYNRKVSKYFSEIFDGKTALVDIGYSGRTQELIYKMIQRSVDGFFIHKNDEECLKRENKYHFRIFSFYDFTPSITGAQREVLFSKLAPSCVGYKILENGSVVPKLEEKQFDFPEFYVIKEIQNSALEFLEKFCSVFEGMQDEMFMRNMDISLPFEHFMAYAEDEDLKMFRCLHFEDDLWAGGVISLSDQWKSNMEYHKLVPYYKENIYQNNTPGINSVQPTENRNYAWEIYHQKNMEQNNIISKMLFWFFVDRDFFKERLKEILRLKK